MKRVDNLALNGATVRFKGNTEPGKIQLERRLGSVAEPLGQKFGSRSVPGSSGYLRYSGGSTASFSLNFCIDRDVPESQVIIDYGGRQVHVMDTDVYLDDDLIRSGMIIGQAYSLDFEAQGGASAITVTIGGVLAYTTTGSELDPNETPTHLLGIPDGPGGPGSVTLRDFSEDGTERELRSLPASPAGRAGTGVEFCYNSGFIWFDYSFAPHGHLEDPDFSVILSLSVNNSLLGADFVTLFTLGDICKVDVSSTHLKLCYLVDNEIEVELNDATTIVFGREGDTLYLQDEGLILFDSPPDRPYSTLVHLGLDISAPNVLATSFEGVIRGLAISEKRLVNFDSLDPFSQLFYYDFTEDYDAHRCPSRGIYESPCFGEVLWGGSLPRHRPLVKPFADGTDAILSLSGGHVITEGSIGTERLSSIPDPLTSDSTVTQVGGQNIITTLGAGAVETGDGILRPLGLPTPSFAPRGKVSSAPGDLTGVTSYKYRYISREGTKGPMSPGGALILSDASVVFGSDDKTVEGDFISTDYGYIAGGNMPPTFTSISCIKPEGTSLSGQVEQFNTRGVTPLAASLAPLGDNLPEWCFGTVLSDSDTSNVDDYNVAVNWSSPFSASVGMRLGDFDSLIFNHLTSAEGAVGQGINASGVDFPGQKLFILFTIQDRAMNNVDGDRPNDILTGSNVPSSIMGTSATAIESVATPYTVGILCRADGTLKITVLTQRTASCWARRISYHVGFGSQEVYIPNAEELSTYLDKAELDFPSGDPETGDDIQVVLCANPTALDSTTQVFLSVNNGPFEETTTTIPDPAWDLYDTSTDSEVGVSFFHRDPRWTTLFHLPLSEPVYVTSELIPIWMSSPFRFSIGANLSHEPSTMLSARSWSKNIADLDLDRLNERDITSTSFLDRLIEDYDFTPAVAPYQDGFLLSKYTTIQHDEQWTGSVHSQDKVTNSSGGSNWLYLERSGIISNLVRTRAGWDINDVRHVGKRLYTYGYSALFWGVISYYWTSLITSVAFTTYENISGIDLTRLTTSSSGEYVSLRLTPARGGTIMLILGDGVDGNETRVSKFGAIADPLTNSPDYLWVDSGLTWNAPLYPNIEFIPCNFFGHITQNQDKFTSDPYKSPFWFTLSVSEANGDIIGGNTWLSCRDNDLDPVNISTRILKYAGTLIQSFSQLNSGDNMEVYDVRLSPSIPGSWTVPSTNLSSTEFSSYYLYFSVNGADADLQTDSFPNFATYGSALWDSSILAVAEDLGSGARALASPFTYPGSPHIVGTEILRTVVDDTSNYATDAEALDAARSAPHYVVGFVPLGTTVFTDSTPNGALGLYVDPRGGDYPRNISGAVTWGNQVGLYGDPHEPNTIWFSESGPLGWESFPSFLKISVPLQGSGVIKALAALHGNLIVLTSDSLTVLSGSPAQYGVSSLGGGVGASTKHCMVVWNESLFSYNGTLWVTQLGQGGAQSEDISQPIRHLLPDDPTDARLRLSAALQSLYLIDTSTGDALRFHLPTKAWTRETRSIKDLADIDGVANLLHLDGTVSRVVPGVFTDPGDTPIEMVIEVALDAGDQPVAIDRLTIETLDATGSWTVQAQATDVPGDLDEPLSGATEITDFASGEVGLNIRGKFHRYRFTNDSNDSGKTSIIAIHDQQK